MPYFRIFLTVAAFVYASCSEAQTVTLEDAAGYLNSMRMHDREGDRSYKFRINGGKLLIIETGSKGKSLFTGIDPTKAYLPRLRRPFPEDDQFALDFSCPTDCIIFNGADKDAQPDTNGYLIIFNSNLEDARNIHRAVRTILKSLGSKLSPY